MNNKKSFFSRMTRRKNSTPAEPEEGAYEIPPPSAIGRMASDSSRRAESMESGYGLDLELLASDEPPRADSANGMNAQESGHAPALESSPAPISDESPDAPKPPRALEMHQEYGLELEVLAASESDESPDAPESLEEHEEAGSGVAEIVAEDSESAPAILEESETEPTSEAAPFEEYGLDLELLAASESDESPDAPEPPQEDDESASSMVESAAKAPASDAEAIGDSAPAHEESLAAPVSDELPDESEPSHDSEPFEGYGAGFEALAVPGSSESPDEVVASHAPEPLPEDEVSSSIPVAPGLPLEQPDEATEISLAEDRFYPLVRDARGNWRPGKGFSRSELREAGLNLTDAARLRIRIDKRRRNAHPMNVSTLEKAKNGG